MDRQTELDVLKELKKDIDYIFENAIKDDVKPLNLNSIIMDIGDARGEEEDGKPIYKFTEEQYIEVINKYLKVDYLKLYLRNAKL